LKDKLIQIGLNASQADIYIRLLSMGAQPVSVLSASLSINRTTTYAVLKSLKKIALVSSYQSAKVKMFVANDPNCLVSYLNRKCSVYDYYKTDILASIESFRSVSGSRVFDKPMLRHFDGLDNVKQLIYDIFTFNCDEYFIYLPLHRYLNLDLQKIFIGCNFSDFKNSTLNILLPGSDKVVAFVDNLKFFKSFNLNYVSVENLDILSDFMCICDDKIIVIDLELGSEYGIVIENIKLAKMHKKIFSLNWNVFDRL